MSHTICAIPGDGIGREVIPAAVAVLQAAVPDLRVEWADAGFETLERSGEALPARTLRLVEGTAATLEFDDESFDIVLSSNALKFLTPLDLNSAMSEMMRVLRPGGTLLIADSDDRAITFSAINEGLGEKIVSAYARFGDPFFGRKLIDTFLVLNRTMCPPATISTARLYPWARVFRRRKSSATN